MHIDWQTVVASMASAACAAGGVGYLLKKGIDRAIDLGFGKLIESQKTHESAGRQASLFDVRAEVLKDLIALSSRARNVCRDIVDLLRSGELTRVGALRERLCSYVSALAELLFEERAMLSVDLQTRGSGVMKSVEFLSSYLSRLDYRPDIIRKADRCLLDSSRVAETTLEQIDSFHDFVVKEEKEKIGVN